MEETDDRGRSPRAAFPLVALVLGAAFVACAGEAAGVALAPAELVAPAAPGDAAASGPLVASPGLASIASAFVSCLFTGVFEEALFRGLLFGALMSAFSGTGLVRLKAAAASSALFAGMHVLADAGSVLSFDGGAALLAIASLTAKAAQAFAFGMAMAALLVCWSRGFASVSSVAKGLAAASLLHAGYDAVAFAPCIVVAGSTPSTYLATDPVQLAFAVATAVVLAVSAVRAWGILKRP